MRELTSAGFLQRCKYDAETMLLVDIPVPIQAREELRTRTGQLGHVEPGARIARDPDVVLREPDAAGFEAKVDSLVTFGGLGQGGSAWQKQQRN